MEKKYLLVTFKEPHPDGYYRQRNEMRTVEVELTEEQRVKLIRDLGGKI